MSLLSRLYLIFQHERTPLLVLLISALLTTGAWYIADNIARQRTAERFAFEIEEAKGRILRRMANYEQVLRGAAALFEAQLEGYPDRQAFQRYVQGLNTNEHFPGIQGIGFALMLQPGEVAPLEQKLQAEGFSQFKVSPPGQRPQYSAIIYLEPMDSRNLRAFGYDMYSESTRHAAMDLARDTGQTAVSGRVILKQETEQDIQAGFLMYLPVYRKNMPIQTLEQRRAALLGFVYSPFRARDLMTGILGLDMPEVAFHLYDDDGSKSSLLYDSEPDDEGKLNYPLFQSVTIELPNHQWTALFHSTPYLLQQTASHQPIMIAAGGAVLDILLFLSVFMINRNREAMRRLAEERGLQQAQSEASLAAIVAGSDDAIISKDLQGTVTSWNQGAENLFGFRADEMLGQSIFKIIPPDKYDEERRVFIDLIKHSNVQHIETLHQRKDGSLVEISATLSPIKDATGNIIGASKIARDISSRKKFERSLAIAKENADAANRAKSDFLANMSHEIRTPMNGVLGLSQLLASTELSKQQRDYLNNIQISARNLLAILNDILDYSKIEAGKLMLENMPFDLDKLLFGLSGLFAADAARKNIEFKIIKQAGMPSHYSGDPLRLNQILNNLLSNALKFTEKGSITLETRYYDEQLHFYVKDTGIGMGDEQRRHLFEAFHQADTSTSRKYGGTGLGLSICKRLVEIMQGEISVQSQIGKGSEFHFYIHAETIQQNDKSLDKSWQLKGLRILIADDDSHALLSLQERLNSWGMHVVTCTDGQSAWLEMQNAAGRGTPFDLTLLDWQMPQMDGISLARKIRNAENISHCSHNPLIMMVTAFGREALLHNSPDLHLDAVLEKPVNPSYLLDSILNILGTRAADNSEEGELERARLRCTPIQGKHILLVEDNEINQLVAQSILQGLGLEVTLAENGKIAVDKIKSNHYDLILMDLQMPVMDGFEASRKIRQIYNDKQLPIIAMTAAAMEKDRMQSSAAGMNDHIAKPVDIDRLCDALLQWIN
ncbi:MAG: CHASE domain-containing protein [Oceanospirillaceae bacterium]|nr:CHASE domain-containing protein [Oceanospirillaceae bacterium]MCP5335857.1 CHASE domain-containing protein [Oceanospirillaceae bacterium]MCP5351127.1 CHASE domain-containing protein [Oceanospirillaceae bacterium]